MMDRRAFPSDATESLWTAEDGWPIRRIDWKRGDTEPRGSMLFLPGRGDHYEKYLETLAYYAAQRLAGNSDWIGAGRVRSGRLLADPEVGHIDDFSTWISDLRYFWTRWKAETPGPTCRIGAQHGGAIWPCARLLKRLWILMPSR